MNSRFVGVIVHCMQHKCIRTRMARCDVESEGKILIQCLHRSILNVPSLSRYLCSYIQKTNEISVEIILIDL